MAVSLTQNMLSPAQYEDRMDNVINQGNTANNSECNGCARKSTENKESSYRDPASQGRMTEQQSSCRQGRLLPQYALQF